VFNNVLKKFFGKKNDGFYLQLEDEDASSKPEPKAKAKLEAVAPVPAANVAVKPESVTPAPVAAPVAASVAAPAAKAEQKAVKNDKKSDKKVAKKVEAPKVAPAPVPTAPAAPPITNFATDYLIKPSSNSSRRRPGANMNKFLELARQTDKPKAFKATAAERKASPEPVPYSNPDDQFTRTYSDPK
jgi:hypothetical protein